MPAVSAIVPSYNHAPFLERRLRSILEQTYQDIEVLVIDDASTDASMTVLERYHTEPRVRIERNAVNSGSPFAQWNRGLARTTAPLVWIAESDDDADPRLLETLVARLERHPRCGLAFAQSLSVDADGCAHGTLTQWTDHVDAARWRTDYASSGREECAQYLAVANTIPSASAVVFRREIMTLVGGAPAHMRLAGDWMTWLRMLLVSDVAFVAAPLNRHRSHAGTVRAAHADDACAWRERLAVWRVAHAALDLPPPTRTRIVDIAREGLVRLLPRMRTERRLIRDLYGFGAALDPSFARSTARLLATRGLQRAAGTWSGGGA